MYSSILCLVYRIGVMEFCIYIRDKTIYREKPKRNSNVQYQINVKAGLIGVVRWFQSTASGV